MDSQECTTDVFKNQHFSFNEKAAYEKGYRFQDGSVYGPTGKPVSLTISTTGYLRFGIRVDRKKKIVLVHRLSAYQKFGDLIYNVECIRHKNGTCTDNSPSNLRLGNQKQNMNDRAPKDRALHSIKAATKLRKFTDAEVLEIRENHTSYKETMKRYGISSKGTLWEILNRDYVTQKAG